MVIDLYQKEILERSKKPHNYGPLEGHTHSGEGFNRICGDHIKLYLTLKENVIERMTFEGESCAIVTASASVMTDIITGQTLTAAKEYYENVEKYLSAKSEEPKGQLQILGVIKAFPSRIQCASLPWNSLYEIIKNL